jgi:hypothetical protein
MIRRSRRSSGVLTARPAGSSGEAIATEVEPGRLMVGERQVANTTTRFAPWQIRADEQALKDHVTMRIPAMSSTRA